MGFLTFLITVVVGIYFWVRLRQLEDRVRKQDLRLQELQKSLVPPTESWVEAPASFEDTMPAGPPTLQIPPAAETDELLPSPFENFVAWLRADFLVKIGALFVILGVGWLLNYLYAQEVLSLELILMGVFGLGLLTAFVGWRQITARPVPGQLIFLTGMATACLTTLAATNLFDLLSVAAGFAVLAVLALLILTVAITKQARYLGYVSLATLYALPFLLEAESPDWLFLVRYGLLVSGLGLLLQIRCKWPLVSLGVLVGVIPYFVGIWNLDGLRTEYALVYLGGIWFGDTILSLLERRQETLSLGRSLLSVVLVSVLAAGFVGEAWQGGVYLTLALLSFVVSYGYRYLLDRSAASRLQFLFGLFYVGVYVAEVWSGADYLALWLGAGLLLALKAVEKTLPDEILVRVLAGLQLIPLLITLQSFGQDRYLPLIIVVTLFLLFTVRTLFQRRDRSELDDGVYKLMTVTTVLTTHAAVWEGLRRGFGDNSVAAGVSLLLFTVTPIWLLYRRRITDGFWRFVSFAILGFVVLRLLTVEVWVMSPLVRVLTFVGVGVWFILTAYLTRRRE